MGKITPKQKLAKKQEKPFNNRLARNTSNDDNTKIKLKGCCEKVSNR